MAVLLLHSLLSAATYRLRHYSDATPNTGLTQNSVGEGTATPRQEAAEGPFRSFRDLSGVILSLKL